MARQQAAARKPSRSKRDRQQESDSGATANGPDAGAATYEQELTEYLTERIKPGLNRGAIPLLARSLAKEIARRNQPEDASEESDVDDEPRTEADDELDDEPRAEADDDFEDEADDDEPEAEADDEPEAEADDEFEDEADDDEFEDEADDEPEAEAGDDEPEDEADDDEPEDEADDDEFEDEPDDEPEDEDDADDEEPAESEVSAFEEEMHQLQEDLGEEWILRFSVQGDEAWLTAEKQDGSQHLEAPTADLLREAVELLDEGGGR